MQAYLPYFFPQAAQVFTQQLSQTALPLPTALPQQQRANQIKKIQKIQKKADKSDSDTEKQAKEETVYVITDASGNKTKQSFPTG